MAAKREAGKIIGWKEIARWLGMPESTVRSLFRRAKFSLPKIGKGGRTSPVYILKDRLLCCMVREAFSLRKRA